MQLCTGPALNSGMTISSDKARSREAARHTDGTFGEQHLPEPAGLTVAVDDTPEPYRPPEQFTRRYDTLEEKMDAYRHELDGAVRGLEDDAEWTRYLDVQAQFHNYSFHNSLLILLQCPQATRVAGASTWRNLGRHPLKGTKAIGIFAPRLAWITPKDANGKPLLGDDGKPKREKRVVGFTTAAVFDVSQTGGDDLPSVDMTLSENPPPHLTPALEGAITDEGYEVRYEDLGGGSRRGYTSFKDKVVVVDSNLGPGNRASTLAHELGHIKAGHMDRMDEYHTGHGGCRGSMEVEAQSIAYVVTRANGMSSDTVRPSALYVDGWSGRDPKAIETAGNAISKAAKAILSSPRFTSHLT